MDDHPSFPNPGEGGPFPSPMIYVTERTRWEYKRLVYNLSQGQPPGEEELNRLGADGWELAAMVHLGPNVYMYVKRTL